MKKNLLFASLALALGLFATPVAFADNGNCGNGQGSGNACLGGGAGGTGIGTGGTGIGTGGMGIGGGAVVSNTNNPTNTITNRVDNTNVNANVNTNRIDSTNKQGQLQGQLQGQQQGQVAKSIASSAANSNQAQSIIDSGNAAQHQSTDNANNAKQNTNIAIAGDAAQARNPVSSAIAPAVAPTAVCALGFGFGAQAVGLGVSFGDSHIDKNCELLEQVRAANSIGQHEVAVEMMQDIPAFAAASKRIADRKSGKVAAASTVVSQAPVVESQYGSLSAQRGAYADLYAGGQ